MDETTPYIAGPPITIPNLFFGRKDQIDVFFKLLKLPQLTPIRVQGGMRSGKSSFLHFVSQPSNYEPELEHLTPAIRIIYVNLQKGIKKPIDFLQVLKDSILYDLPQFEETGDSQIVDSFRTFDLWLSKVLRQYRLVILLDNFERFSANSLFDRDFFYMLRSLVDGKLVWVTASNKSIFSITKPSEEEDNASPLYNVFRQTPIYLGPMESQEAEDLIRKPLVGTEVTFSNQEVGLIRKLSGDMPYLLQEVAAFWYQAVVNDIKEEERSTWVIEQMMSYECSMPRQFKKWWEKLSLKEKSCIELRLKGPCSPPSSKNKDCVTMLSKYGYLVECDKDYKIAPELFSFWIAESCGKSSKEV